MSASNRSEVVIILPGFDYEAQLRLDFSAPHFYPAWMRRVYTKEKDHYPSNLGDHVRYGNNITILFRACYKLSRFYGTPGFWPAVASGFSLGSYHTEAMVDHLSRARAVYRSHHSDEEFYSGATKAADAWIRFVGNRTNLYRPSSGRHEPDHAAMGIASDYYSLSKGQFLQVDAAAILTRRGMEETQRPIRKRSRSPSPLGQLPPAKRRPSPDRFERPSARPVPSVKASLPPLTTDIEGPEQGKQEYPTPSSTRAQPEQYASLPRAPLVEPQERKIRDLPQQDTRSSPPQRIGEPLPEIRGTSRTSKENRMPLQIREQGTADGQRDTITSIREKTGTPTATRTVSPASGLVTEMKARIESLEKRVREAEADREKESDSAKALIASFEARMKELEESRSAQAVLMQKMQAKLAVMESPPALVEREMPTNDALENNKKEMLKMQDRVTTLEDQGEWLRRTVRGLSQTHTNGASPTPPEDIHRSMEDMARKVKALPTMSNVSEKVFQVERRLRDMLQEYQRNNDERVDGASKNQETMRVQVRELAKEFDKAKACLPAKASLTAVETQVAWLTKQMGSVRESIAQDKKLAALLEGKVDTLSSELHDASLASLSDRIQELSSRTDSLEKQMTDAQADAQAEEDLASVNARVNILTQSFLDLLGQLCRDEAGKNALGS